MILRSPSRLSTALLSAGAALFLIAAAPAEPISGNKESQGYYDDARKQLEKGDGRGAMIQLKNALRADPKNTAARHLLGLIYLRSGDGELAEKELRTAIQNGYPEEQALVSLAEAYMNQHKHEELLRDFPPGDRAPALELKVRLLRAFAEAALGRHDEARKTFADAATLDPKSPSPLAGLARIDIDEGKLDAAAANLKRALAVDPKSPEALSLMGEIERVHGHRDQALDLYTQALAQDARTRTALTGRALLMLDRGETDKADADIKVLQTTAPNNPITHYLKALSQAQRKDTKGALATLQKQQSLTNYAPAVFLQSVLQIQDNQLEQAIAGFERYIEMQLTDDRARKLLANIYLRRNDAERAVKVLTPTLERMPDDVETLSMLGGAYLAQRQYDRATELLARAAAIDPASAQVQTRLAAGQLQAGEPTQALKALEQAISLNPSETEANLLLVMTHLRDRDFKAARTVAERFQTVQPKSPLPLAMLGTIARAEGNRPAARDYFEKAVALQPDYTAGHMALAQLDLDDGKPAAAAARYEEILKRDKNNLPATMAMANLLARQGKSDGAVTWLERARSADLTAVDPRFALVDLYLTRKEPSKAVVIAGELTTIAPQSSRATAALGGAQFAAGDRDAAFATFRRAASLQPNAPQPLQLLARAQIESGDPAAARATLQQAVSIAPDFEPARLDLIAVELKAGQKDAALKVATDWRDARPTHPPALALVGNVLMRETRYADAVTAYEALAKAAPSATSVAQLVDARTRAGMPEPNRPLQDFVAAHPEDPQGYQLLGQRQLAAKDMAGARKTFEKADALAPNDAATLNNLAWIYQTAGDPRAAELAQRAHALAPGSPDIADTFGWILVQRGEVDKGVPILRDAAAKLPNNAEVRYHLAAALVKSGDQDNGRRMLQALLESGDTFDGAMDARALLASLTR